MSRDVIGRRVTLPGHFVDEVTVEGACLLGSAAELLVRLPTGELYAALNALANLGDVAGRIFVSVKAASETGLDTARLENPACWGRGGISG